MIDAVRSIDERFLERTLAFLLFISMIPWPTAACLELRRPGSPRRGLEQFCMQATMLMMGLSFTWGWRYLSARPGDRRRACPPRVPSRGTQLLQGPHLCVAIAVAFLAPPPPSLLTPSSPSTSLPPRATPADCPIGGCGSAPVRPARWNSCQSAQRRGSAWCPAAAANRGPDAPAPDRPVSVTASVSPASTVLPAAHHGMADPARSPRNRIIR